jgi:hypothetical protein
MSPGFKFWVVMSAVYCFGVGSGISPDSWNVRLLFMLAAGIFGWYSRRIFKWVVK